MILPTALKPSSTPMKKLLVRLFLLTAFSLPQAFADDAFVGEESRSAIIAVQRYKDLSKPDTELYRAYQSLLGQAIKVKSQVFKDPKWPLLIAEKAHGSLGALQQGARAVGRVKIEKYEETIKEMIASGPPEDQAWARLELAAYEAELAGNTAEAKAIRQKQGELDCLLALKKSVALLSTELALLRVEVQLKP
jgi:hypothetical protein